MKFGSVCSGIEAASVAWNPLGWKAQWLAEIEPFPCSLLAHHYPDTPNLGDMTKFNEWPTDDKHAIDLLCGGTPCQSFSVAGLRKGLDDPRGNLMLTFGAIAAKYKPKWIMWENVPGVVRSNGGQDFTSFLDMLEELGYICDIEILDAQYFGVAQRRRRVFVCGQHRDDLLSQKTDSSALTITQCLQEILQTILTEGCSKLGNALGSSALPMHSRDGATRRMRLFGLDGESECWPMLRENLIAAFQRYQQEQKQSAAPLGEPEKEPMPGGQLTALSAESLFTLTEQSLKSALDEAFEVMRLFTTLTPTSPITQAQIYTCSRAALLIAKLTLLLNQSSPAFWNSALSSLTVIEEYTNYARSTNSDLFGDVERVQAWSDFIEQAEHTNDALLDIGIECAGEIFTLPACLQGHPAPRRQAGQAITGTLSARTEGGGGLGTDFDCSGGVQPVAGTLTVGGKASGSATQQDAEAGLLVPVGVTIHGTDGTATVASYSDTAQCLRARPPGFLDNSSTTVVQQPMGFAQNQRDEVRMMHVAGALAAEPGAKQQTYVALPIAFPERMSGTQCASTENLAPSMGALNPTAVAVSLRGREGGATAELGDEVGNCLRASGGGGDKAHVLAYTTKLHNTTSNNAGKIFEERTACLDANSPPPALLTAMQVRRLTPTECEALQGFPLGYTNVPHRGKPAADGPRYKSLGNSWAVPNVRWIGRRIEEVFSITKNAKVAA
jgi:DNA-cytosine methyltransferase